MRKIAEDFLDKFQVEKVTKQLTAWIGFSAKQTSAAINENTPNIGNEKSAFFFGFLLASAFFIYPKWNRKLNVFVNMANLVLSGLELLTPTRAELTDKDIAAILKIRRGHTLMPIGLRVSVRSIQEIPIQSAAGHRIPIHVITPLDVRSNPPIIVYIHGGGFVVGNSKMYEPITTRLAASTRCVVVGIDYRKAPEAKFPEGALDCIEATQWIYYNAHKLANGCDNTRLVVLGDSAGGNLTSIVSLELKHMVALSIPIYPVVTFGVMSTSKVQNADAPILKATTMDWYSLRYFNSAKEQIHVLANPLQRDDLSDAPRTHVITADVDVLRDEGVELYNALKKAGVKATYKNYTNTVHGFFGAVLLPHGMEALSDVIDLILEHFGLSNNP